LCQEATFADLFDYFIGAGEQRLRDIQIQRPQTPDVALHRTN